MTHDERKLPQSKATALFTASGAPSDKPGLEGKSPKQLAASAKRAGGFAWIGLTNPSPDEVVALGNELNIPELAVHDASSGGQQPKVQFYGDDLLVVLWTLRPADEDLRFEIVETFIYATDHVLMTVEYGVPEEGSVREALQGAVPSVSGVTGAAYKILARAAESYTHAAHGIEEELEALEDQVFDPSRTDDARRIYRLRRHIGRVKRAVSGLTRSLERAVSGFERADGDEHAVRPYLRHVLDDLVGTDQLTNDQDNALDGIIARHENDVASQQNRDARRISALAALIAVPAVIAGIYGMNFKNLPLVNWEYGWVVIIGAIAVVVVSLAYYFRRVHWL
jgi:magnesium transporter